MRDVRLEANIFVSNIQCNKYYVIYFVLANFTGNKKQECLKIIWKQNVLPASSSPQIRGSFQEKWPLKSIKINNTSSCPMNSMYVYFFLITYHMYGGNSVLIPHADFISTVTQPGVGGDGERGGMNAANPFSIWIRILLMAFSFPSVNRTSLTSAEIATWKKKGGWGEHSKQWANMLVCVEVKTGVTSLQYHASSPISL